MPQSVCRTVSEKYCLRFGQIAVEKGFISEIQLREGLDLQAAEDEAGSPHRLLGAILFDKGWMTSRQIDEVMTDVLKRMRKEAA